MVRARIPGVSATKVLSPIVCSLAPTVVCLPLPVAVETSATSRLGAGSSRLSRLDLPTPEGPATAETFPRMHIAQLVHTLTGTGTDEMHREGAGMVREQGAGRDSRFVEVELADHDPDRDFLSSARMMKRSSIRRCGSGWR